MGSFPEGSPPAGDRTGCGVSGNRSGRRTSPAASRPGAQGGTSRFAKLSPSPEGTSVHSLPRVETRPSLGYT